MVHQSSHYFAGAGGGALPHGAAPLHSSNGGLCARSQEQQVPPPKLLPGWYRPVAAGSGLINLGNSCFLNSVLQCLAHVPPLANLCLVQAHSRVCRHAQQLGPCMCCLVERQVCRMLSSQSAASSADAPRALFSSLTTLNRGFVRGAQEDAHELLRCLSDAMERCLLRQAGLWNGNPRTPLPRCPRTWVNHIFQGILQSQVRCTACGHVSSSHDVCMDLSLDLRGCASLEACLQQYTAVEHLAGDNAYRCEGCKALVPARKQLTIWDDPNVLVVHLKRFDGIFGGKIDRHIRFPTQLNLEPFISRTRKLPPQQQTQNGCSGAAGAGCSGMTASLAANNAAAGGDSDDGSADSSGRNNAGKQQQQQQPVVPRTSPGEYSLRGVLVHSGLSAHSGHYYSYVKDGIGSGAVDGCWHCMNDSSVYRVSTGTVLEQSAYMLFYVRSVMKPQAALPPPQQQQPAAGAAAAAAAGAAGRLKRGSSEDGGGGAAAAASGAAPLGMIGPQLPPHLQAKRQRVAEPQPNGSAQQQQQQDEDSGGGAGSPPGGVAYGPALPPHLAQQLQQHAGPMLHAEPSSNGTHHQHTTASNGNGVAPVSASLPAAAAASGVPNGGMAADEPSDQHHHQQHQQQQQQQQEQEPEASAHVPPAAAAGDSQEAAFRRELEARLRDARSDWQPWLAGELRALRQQGVSLAEAKRRLLGALQRNSAVRGVAVWGFRQLQEMAAGGGGGRRW